MGVNRREFLAAAVAVGTPERKALVTRHNPVYKADDVRAPLGVGNGEFAFSADITGLQTFPEKFEKTFPLCTQSQWGWHSFSRPAGTLKLVEYDTNGRKVGYPSSGRGQEEIYNWLRENPHRLHLGRVGLLGVKAEDISSAEQTFDLWTGLLTSRFQYKGKPVTVRTCVHPTLDMLACEIDAPLKIVVAFPYGSPKMDAADWTKPQAHKTTGEIKRTLDSDSYFVSIRSKTEVRLERQSEHVFALHPAQNKLSFTILFEPLKTGAAHPDCFAACAEHWARFWSTGASVEFPENRELERRAILSQYLTAIHCAGSLPPQETGLTMNSWYGKFHLEMHWWHAAHFAMWGRPQMLARSLGWYGRILPSAKAKARSQGYEGARWPKMTGPDGEDSPSNIGPFLIWQQPHPISYAELMYAAHPEKRTLEQYRDIVFESAQFMASFAHWDGKRYVLGPPVIPAQENHPPRETWNPTFELEYWAHALGLAQTWRKRLGIQPEPKWEHVRTNLSALPVKDGVYLAHENCPQTFTERNRDHPSMLAALGVLPGEGVDRAVMRRTLDKVNRQWKWADTWGWDYPMVAMTATELGDAKLAIDVLLMKTAKNEYVANGHNYQRPGLPCYLPGNGGLLAAIAKMGAKGMISGWRAS
jgi:hypothetical protein